MTLGNQKEKKTKNMSKGTVNGVWRKVGLSGHMISYSYDLTPTHPRVNGSEKSALAEHVKAPIERILRSSYRILVHKLNNFNSDWKWWCKWHFCRDDTIYFKWRDRSNKDKYLSIDAGNKLASSNYEHHILRSSQMKGWEQQQSLPNQ